MTQDYIEKKEILEIEASIAAIALRNKGLRPNCENADDIYNQIEKTNEFAIGFCYAVDTILGSKNVPALLTDIEPFVLIISTLKHILSSQSKKEENENAKSLSANDNRG